MSLSFIQVLLAPTLELAKGVVADVSVEAEYGSHVVDGAVLTLAHHQSEGGWSTKGGARAPCCARTLIAEHNEALKAHVSQTGALTILVSHLDLDTIGGIGRVLAQVTGLTGDQSLFTNHEGFWRLAEHVGLKGPHRATRCDDATDANLLALNAYWAHAGSRPRERAEVVTNVTGEVELALMKLHAILVGQEPTALAAGKRHTEEGQRLDANSLMYAYAGGVVVRAHPGFVNHLYGAHGRAVVAYNQAQGSITLSLADPVPGVSCRALVQELFGPEAGGHDGIAGSPRGKRMSFEDFSNAVETMIMALDAGM